MYRNKKTGRVADHKLIADNLDDVEEIGELDLYNFSLEERIYALELCQNNSKDKLKEICKENELKVSGSEHELSLRIAKYESKRI